MIEKRRLKSVVIFFQTILSFALRGKITNIVRLLIKKEINKLSIVIDMRHCYSFLVKYLKEIYLTTYLILLKKMIFFLNISGLIYKMRYIGIEGMSLKPLPYFWKIDYKEYYWMTKLLYGNQC